MTDGGWEEGDAKVTKVVSDCRLPQWRRACTSLENARLRAGNARQEAASAGHRQEAKRDLRRDRPDRRIVRGPIGPRKAPTPAGSAIDKHSRGSYRQHLLPWRRCGCRRVRRGSRAVARRSTRRGEMGGAWNGSGPSTSLDHKSSAVGQRFLMSASGGKADIAMKVHSALGPYIWKYPRISLIRPSSACR